jgi:adenine nucleotide transporter 17
MFYYFKIITHRGLETTLIGMVVSQMIYYFCYELFGSMMHRDKENNLYFDDAVIVSTISGIITAIITNPIWVINSRVMTMKPKYMNNNILNNLTVMIRNEGVFVLTSGLTSSLILVTNPVIQFTLYETIKIYLLSLDFEMSKIDYFWLGAITKLVAISMV